MLFDNHKFTSYLATLRFMIAVRQVGGNSGDRILADPQLDQHPEDRRRAPGAESPFIIGKRATIADFSLCGYLFFGEELTVPLEPHTHVLNWLDRIRALCGSKRPLRADARARNPDQGKFSGTGAMASRYSSRCSNSRSASSPRRSRLRPCRPTG